jgi:hypothetical protein
VRRLALIGKVPGRAGAEEREILVLKDVYDVLAIAMSCGGWPA